MDQKTAQIWGTITISVLVMALFVACLAVATFLKDNTSLQLLIGAVVSMSSAIVGYWVGSSASSSKKDDTIAAAAVRPGGEDAAAKTA